MLIKNYIFIDEPVQIQTPIISTVGLFVVIED